MNYKNLLISKCILLGVFLILATHFTSIHAAANNVGVDEGDWLIYEVDSTWTGSGPEPDWASLARIKWEVQDVTGTVVTLLNTFQYKDGSEDSKELSFDVAEMREMIIISAGLEKGDASLNGMPLNDTVTRVYAGAYRSVNLLKPSPSYEDLNHTFFWCWDQETGSLLEVSMNVTSPAEAGRFRFRVIDTNMWSPPPILVTSYLSSEVVTQGDSITLSVEVKDDAGTPVEGATVTATLGPRTVTLSDTGGGSYQGTIDTTNVGKGTSEIIIEVEATGYETAQISRQLLVEIPPSFVLKSLVINPSSVEKGGTVEISVMVTNTGGRSGSFLVTLLINDDAEDEKTVTLSPDETETVRFMVTAAQEGTFSVNLHGLTGSYAVFNPVTFTLSGLVVEPRTVNEGETVTVSVKVTNIGEESASYPVTLRIDGEVEDEKTANVAPGETETVSFRVSATTEGTFAVDVNSLDGSYTVTKASGLRGIPGFPDESIILGLVTGALIRARARKYDPNQPPTTDS